MSSAPLFRSLLTFVAFLFFANSNLTAQEAPNPAASSAMDELARAEDLFLYDRLDEAAPLFESVLRRDPTNEDVRLYLGYIYEQRGRYDEAVRVLQQGTEIGGARQATLFFNLGNTYFRQGLNNFAEEMYGEAVNRSPLLSDAYLNRANVRINLQRYREALSDYTAFLQMEPSNSQRDAIGRMIRLLQGMIDTEDRAALEAENRRQREAQLQREAEARRQALIDEVLRSLQQSTGETTGISAGAAGIQEYYEAYDIED